MIERTELPRTGSVRRDSAETGGIHGRGGGAADAGFCRWASSPERSVATSAADVNRAAGCLDINLSTIAASQSGTRGLISRIGRAGDSHTCLMMPKTVSA